MQRLLLQAVSIVKLHHAIEARTAVAPAVQHLPDNDRDLRNVGRRGLRRKARAHDASLADTLLRVLSNGDRLAAKHGLEGGRLPEPDVLMVIGVQGLQ